MISGRTPYLALSKTSNRTNEVPTVVADALTRHLATYPVAGVELDNETDPRKPTKRRAAPGVHPRGGTPIHRADWSYLWRRAAEAAGLPKGFGLRDLRHYFASVVILGHTTPTITLNT